MKHMRPFDEGLRLQQRKQGHMAKTNLKTERPKIEAGYRVGKLIAVKKTEQRRHGYTVWYCRCDCGSGIFLDTRQLQRGTVRDCGCSGIKVKPRQKDLTGQRFGKLVCIEPTDERGSSGGTIWRCQCDCGNECLAVITQLTRGYKKSCGCLSHPPLKDYVEKQFGILTVIGYAGKRDGLHYWHCRCGCGEEIVVGQTRLQSGQTTNCGCKHHPAWKQYAGRQIGDLTVQSFSGTQDGIPYWKCKSADGNEIVVPQNELPYIGSRDAGDLTGRTFGRLMVLGFKEWKDGSGYWQCRCECGNLTVVRYGNLIYGHTKSCGCLQREIHQKNMQLIDGTSVRMIEKRMSSTIKSNTSGYNGVYLNRNGTWTAQITFKGKTYYLGSYADIRDAVKARKRGEEMYEQFLAWYYSEHTNGGTAAGDYKKE